MFFIVSTGRCGSQTMAYTLNQYANCICRHEPPPQLIEEGAEYRYGTLNAATIQHILTHTRPRDTDGQTYGESSQILSLIIPILEGTFPGSKYVWLVRNGLDFVVSAVGKGWYAGRSADYRMRPYLERVWMDARIDGTRCGDVPKGEWADMDAFARCCWYWRYINQLIENDLKAISLDEQFVIRLEAIKSQLPVLARWLGLRAVWIPPIQTLNVANYPVEPWGSWTEQQRDTFSFWCGELMDCLYPGWRDPSGSWRGVEYDRSSSLLSSTRFHPRIIRAINSLRNWF
jgi:hypothetical protein